MDLEKRIEDSFLSSRCAVQEKDAAYTYRQLGAAVRFFRAYLVRSGVRRIMLCLPQSFQAYALILSAYLARVTYCPVDPDAPPYRKRYFVDVYRPDLIVTNSKTDFPDDLPAPVIRLDAFCQDKLELPEPPAPQAAQRGSEENPPAYVIFTSGSTGMPKGVSVSRAVLRNFVSFGLEEYGVTPADVWGQFSKLSFDLSVFDIFVAVAAGARLIPIASRGAKLLPARMIEKYGITYWHSVPSVMELIAFDRCGGQLNTLRIMNFAGEPLYPEIVKKLFAVNPTITIYNVFGHTETTFAMYQKLTAADYARYADSTMSIGRPIPNYDVFLHNERDGIGEIVITGLIADGYIGETAHTAFRTILHNGVGERAFFSGDYAYSRRGNLYFWGRTDSQIKLRGNRIDLNEIDNAFRVLGFRSATIYHQDAIVSFLLGDENAPARIREGLLTILPEYSIPQKIVPVDTIPYNTNGKIDRGALFQLLGKTEDSQGSVSFSAGA